MRTKNSQNRGDKNMTNKLMMTAVTLLMLASAVSAQNNFPVSRKQVAHIPFSFTANEHTYPAGTYLLESDPEKQTIVLRGENKGAQLMLTNRDELRQAPDKGELVFQRYGSQFILKTVRVQGSYEAQTLPTGKVERELAKVTQPQQVVAVQTGSR
jgi:hypothetical protein